MTLQSAWRIVKAKHAEQAFDGEGAKLFGGRWNSIGTPMVYLAESRSLALLELLVHLREQSVLQRYVRYEVGFEAELCEELDYTKLPDDWRSSPAPDELKRMGDEWAHSQRSLVLAVPSVIVPEERTLLLNPEHPEFEALYIDEAEAVRVDSRLVDRVK